MTDGASNDQTVTERQAAAADDRARAIMRDRAFLTALAAGHVVDEPHIQSHARRLMEEVQLFREALEASDRAHDVWRKAAGLGNQD